MKKKTRRIRCASCPCYDAEKEGFGYRLVGEEVVLFQEKGCCRAAPPTTHSVGSVDRPQAGVSWLVLASGWSHVERRDWCACHPMFQKGGSK
jgi:hypothetical protein